MAHSGKLRFPASGDGPQSAGGNPAQQQLGVERTSSQLLMTVASRLHERLAHSVSLKLASLEAIDPHKVRLAVRFWSKITRTSSAGTDFEPSGTFAPCTVLFG